MVAGRAQLISTVKFIAWCIGTSSGDLTRVNFTGSNISIAMSSGYLRDLLASIGADGPEFLDHRSTNDGTYREKSSDHLPDASLVTHDQNETPEETWRKAKELRKHWKLKAARESDRRNQAYIDQVQELAARKRAALKMKASTDDTASSSSSTQSSPSPSSIASDGT